MIYEFSTPPCHSEERSDEDELLRTLSEKSRVHPLIRLRYVLEILRFALNDRGKEYRVILSVSEESVYIK